ncbi:MAG: IS5 family transposase [Eubacteriaceae bacterium]|nr:IS5 family transposase [Eubacteriaceae bacterium]
MPVDAVLQALSWLLATGAPWRDMPERLGKWQAVYGRFRKWIEEGLVERILGSIAAGPAGEGHVDSTYAKGHRASAGAAASSEGSRGQGIDSARGGRAAKTHALADGGGKPVAILWTPASMHDGKAAVPLFYDAEFEDGARVAGGKAYGSVDIRAYLEAEGAGLVSPPKKNAKNPEAL